MADMNNMILKNKVAIPNKLLQEDGSITDLAGNPVTNAVDAYKNRPALPNKVLNADGSYSTLSEIIGGSGTIDLFVVVQELPQTGEENKIYLVPKESGQGFTEWIYVDEQWDTIGELEATVPGCNLGLVDDYTTTNPLDLNQLTPGIYYLNNPNHKTTPLHVKATYNGQTYTAQWTDNDDYSIGIVMIELDEKVPTTVTDSYTYIGRLIIWIFRDSGATPEISYKYTSIRLEPNLLNLSLGGAHIIQPVKLGAAQTITGVKTFAALPKTSIVPTDDDHLVNKKYVDDAIASNITSMIGGAY